MRKIKLGFERRSDRIMVYKKAKEFYFWPFY